MQTPSGSIHEYKIISIWAQATYIYHCFMQNVIIHPHTDFNGI